jgi:hypothetical protein
MGIPTLNKSQVTTLMDLANGMGAFSQAIPDKALDKAEDYESAMETVRDNEQMLILGLIKEITEDCGDKLAVMYSMTNRLFRVFQITDTGQKMFEGSDKRTVQ